MTRRSVAAVLILGNIAAITLVQAIWGIGFAVGTYKGRPSQEAINRADRAALLLFVLYASIVVGMAVLWEHHIRNRTPLMLSILRGIGLTFLLGVASILLALGLAYCDCGGIIFRLADILIDAARWAASEL